MYKVLIALVIFMFLVVVTFWQFIAPYNKIESTVINNSPFSEGDPESETAFGWKTNSFAATDGGKEIELISYRMRFPAQNVKNVSVGKVYILDEDDNILKRIPKTDLMLVKQHDSCYELTFYLSNDILQKTRLLSIQTSCEVTKEGLFSKSTTTLNWFSVVKAKGNVFRNENRETP